MDLLVFSATGVHNASSNIGSFKPGTKQRKGFRLVIMTKYMMMMAYNMRLLAGESGVWCPAVLGYRGTRNIPLEIILESYLYLDSTC